MIEIRKLNYLFYGTSEFHREYNYFEEMENKSESVFC